MEFLDETALEVESLQEGKLYEKYKDLSYWNC